MASEILLTTEKSGLLCNVCMYDLHTGTVMRTYKDDSSSTRSLCLMNGEYIVSATNNKPLIYVWSIQQKERVHCKLIAPGPVTALTLSPDNSYIVAAVSEKIHVWQVASGNLLCVLSHHHQAVRKLVFSDDGAFFLSAGNDCLIMVWQFDKVLRRNTVGHAAVEPWAIWTGHSLPVTDLCCGSGGPAARVVSASLDHTCKVWDLLTGQTLVTFLLNRAVTSVVMNTTETHAYAGCDNGDIHRINLIETPPGHHVTAQTVSAEDIFKGHSACVRCLAVTLDGSQMVSGADDASVRLWDVASGQCVRTIAHKGPITNLLVAMTPRDLVTSQHKNPTPVRPLKKTLCSTDDDVLDILRPRDVYKRVDKDHISNNVERFINMAQSGNDECEGHIETMQTMKMEMQKLADVCQKVYQHSITNTLK